jgi:hypothetical protein
MQRLEIRISFARVTCFDDVKVGRVFGAIKPGLSGFKDTQGHNEIHICMKIKYLSSVL